MWDNFWGFYNKLNINIRYILVGLSWIGGFCFIVSFFLIFIEYGDRFKFISIPIAIIWLAWIFGWIADDS